MKRVPLGLFPDAIRAIIEDYAPEFVGCTRHIESVHDINLEVFGALATKVWARGWTTKARLDQLCHPGHLFVWGRFVGLWDSRTVRLFAPNAVQPLCYPADAFREKDDGLWLQYANRAHVLLEGATEPVCVLVSHLPRSIVRCCLNQRAWFINYEQALGCEIVVQSTDETLTRLPVPPSEARCVAMCGDEVYTWTPMPAGYFDWGARNWRTQTIRVIPQAGLLRLWCVQDGLLLFTTRSNLVVLDGDMFQTRASLAYPDACFMRTLHNGTVVTMTRDATKTQIARFDSTSLRFETTWECGEAADAIEPFGASSCLVYFRKSERLVVVD